MATKLTRISSSWW